jgi:Fic family protein
MAAKPHPNFTWDQIDALRTQAGVATGDGVPANAFTASEYAAKYGLPYATASGQLARMVRTGSLKTARKRGTLPSGRQGPMRYYWPS